MNTSDRSHETPRRFEPMLLLVWGLPAVVVVAGLVTLGIAIRAGQLDASSDAVRRMAQVQQTDMRADAQALRRGLSASLRVEDGALQLQLLGAGEADDALSLHFEHPSNSKLDRHIALQRDGSVWTARIDLPVADHWRLVLRASDASWRLDGELRGHSGIAVLSPRFGHG
ncbi:FixH family protein [Pseudomarimonas salicorniae]|uniref:FixH family protein n=1 Tax=Pseudomarimonas salicorniae TaxID=2933270 RepID=A0ABT0GDY2_9GAMM|nr:FixH family protein [Lysobacter sp. CAU 1642]MCK7592760.1 FixH family protein [Lysobacter sp. CAU 1642]